MKISRIVMAFMVAATMFSCQKIEQDDNGSNSQRPLPEGDYSVFTIGAPEIGPATKMTLGPVEGSDSEMVLWEVGDEVWIMREGGDAGSFWANSIKDGGKSADFYGLQFSTGGKYRAVYPSSAVTYWENGPAKRYDSFKAVLPSVQKYVPNSFPKEANLSMAEWDEDKGEKRLMKNLAGAIRFNLTGNITVGRLELYSSTSLLNGYYDMAKEAFFEMPTVYNEQYDCELGQYRTVLDCSYDIEREDGLIERMSVKLNENEPTQFNFVVAPGALSHGFELSIYDAEGERINTLSTNKDNTVERSSIVVMPTINVVTEEKAGDPTLVSDVNSVVNNMLTAKNSSTRAVKNVVFESNSDRTSDYVVSADGYLTKAYVDYDAETNTLYYSTAAEQMYLATGNQLFYFYDSLEDIKGLNNLNVSNVYDFEGMFQNCSKLTEIDLSPLNASKAISLNSMFEGCINLKSVNLSGLGIETVENMARMFSDCRELEEIDLSGLNLDPYPRQGHLDYLFMNCHKLGHVKFAPDFSPENWNYNHMFQDAGYLAQDKTMYIDCSYSFQSIFKDREASRSEGQWSDIGSYGPKGSETLENTERVVNYVFKEMPTALYYNATFNETAKTLANSSNVITKSGSNMTKESVDSKIKHIKYDIMSSVPCPYPGEYNFMVWNEDSGTITVYFTSDIIYNVELGFNDAEGMFQNMAALEDIDNLGVFRFSYDLTGFANMFKGCYSLRELCFYDTAWEGNVDLSSYDFTGFIDGVGSAIGKTVVSCSRDMMKAIVDANPSSSSSVIWDVPERKYDVELDTCISHDFGEKLKALANDMEINTPVLSSITNTKSYASKSGYYDVIEDNLIRHIVFTRGTYNPVGDWYDAYAHWDEETATITVYNTSGSEYAFYMNEASAEYAFQDFKALEDIKGLDLIASRDVQRLEGMFAGCESLKELDLSSFDTSILSNIAYMFADCKSLSSLDLTDFKISSDTYYEGIIANAGTKAKELAIKCDISFQEAVDYNPKAGWNSDVNYVWDVDDDVETGTIITDIDLSGVFGEESLSFNTLIKNAVNGRTDMTETSLDSKVKSFDFVFEVGTTSPIGPDNEDFAHFDENTGKVTIYHIFDDITEEALNEMTYPIFQSSFFRGFTAVETLDLSGCEIHALSYLAAGCRNLKELILPIDRVYDGKCEGVLEGTSTLSKSLRITCDFETKNLLINSGISGFTPIWNVAYPETIAFTRGYNINNQVKEIAGLSRIPVKYGDEEDYIEVNESIEKIVFETNCSDLDGKEKEEEVYIIWDEPNGTFKFRTSLDKFTAPGDMYSFFDKFVNLKQIIGLEKVDFSGTTVLWNAFYIDHSLTSLDLSIMASDINDMDSAFYGCSSLRWLDISGISTSNSWYLCNMLFSCRNLHYLRLGEGFVIPSQGCDLEDMFSGTSTDTADQTLNIACPDSVWEQLTSMASELGLDPSVTLVRITDEQFLAARSNVRTLSPTTTRIASKPIKISKRNIRR